MLIKMIIKKVAAVEILFKGISHQILSHIFNKSYHKYSPKK